MKIHEHKEIKIDGEKLKIHIILPYFNEDLGMELYENAKKTLIKNNVKEENIKLSRVSGALEIPFACQKITKREKPDAIIGLGIIIRGETSHYDLVSENTYNGIMKVQLETGIPIAFGILSCENIEQAKNRVMENGLNKGKEAAEAALIQTNI
jgi:6,7-dimethyl-8-ribityllumazine synthase